MAGSCGVSKVVPVPTPVNGIRDGVYARARTKLPQIRCTPAARHLLPKATKSPKELLSDECRAALNKTLGWGLGELANSIERGICDVKFLMVKIVSDAFFKISMQAPLHN